MRRNLFRNGFLILILLLFSLFASTVHAQDNYEIQVYGSDLVEPKNTMVELHSNFTFDGSKEEINGVLPTNHVFHETIEITHGFDKWFELGFYFFNSIGNNGRTNYVGSHIRPRFAIPKSYDLPVGLSLSAEFGFQNSKYSEDTWSIEIRPIIDKQWSKLYLSFNPTFDRAFLLPCQRKCRSRHGRYALRRGLLIPTHQGGTILFSPAATYSSPN